MRPLLSLLTVFLVVGCMSASNSQGAASPGGWFHASSRHVSAEHGGTHFDAPIHFAEGRRTSDEALPMKIKGGSGGPLRIVAWAP